METTADLLQRIRRRQGGICFRCGAYIESFSSQLYHRDGDRTNFNTGNLLVVCRGCYSYLAAQKRDEPVRKQQTVVSWRF